MGPLLETEQSSPERGRGLIGALGLAIAIWQVVSFLIDLNTPSPTGPNALSAYVAHADILWADELALIVLVGLSVPFFVGVGRILAPRSPTVIGGAVLLVAAGFLVFMVGETIEFVGLWAVTQGPTLGVYAPSATVQASFAYVLGSTMYGFGFFLLGAGLILLAWVSWGSELFPKWLSTLAFVAGIMAILSQVPALTFFLYVAVAILYLIFALVIGYRLIRPGRSAIPEAVPEDSRP